MQYLVDSIMSKVAQSISITRRTRSCKKVRSYLRSTGVNLGDISACLEIERGPRVSHGAPVSRDNHYDATVIVPVGRIVRRGAVVKEDIEYVCVVVLGVDKPGIMIPELLVAADIYDEVGFDRRGVSIS